jgi:hypothetical protein
MSRVAVSKPLTRSDLRPVGGRYYDDGFGNLIGFGTFKAPKLGGLSRYALTFRKSGGIQLALDFGEDAIVDVLLELDRDGRLGALADPDTQWFLDCMSQQIAGGSNLVAAANHCLESVGGGGGGLGRSREWDADRLSEPDCDEQGGVPGSVAGPKFGSGFGSVSIVELDGGYEMTIERHETNSGQVRLDAVVRDATGRIVYEESRVIDEYGEVTDRTTVEHRYDENGHYVDSHVTRWEDGDQTGEATVIDDPNDYDDVIDVEIGEATIEETEPAPQPDTDSTRQPGPECEDCPVEDPRCAEAPNDIASLWDCQAETSLSLIECIERMQDAIYNATGGRCATEPGADDRPSIAVTDASTIASTPAAPSGTVSTRAHPVVAMAWCQVARTTTSCAIRSGDREGGWVCTSTRLRPARCSLGFVRKVLSSSAAKVDSDSR